LHIAFPSSHVAGADSLILRYWWHVQRMATAPEPETGVWAMRAKYEKQLLKDEYDLFWWAKQQDTYFDWKVDVTDEFDTRSEKILCALHLQTMHM
jgi:hypothetical protein